MLLDVARESIADSLGCRPDELSFTASATQSLHAAVLGTLNGYRRAGRVFVHSAVEHSAVLHAAALHQAAGGSTVAVGVDRFGRVDLDRFVAAAAAGDVAAAALQAANHEVGTLQPVQVLAERLRSLTSARRQSVPLIVDAGQTIGKAVDGKSAPGPLRVALPDGWSVLSADPRRWGGAPGVGILAVRTGIRWKSPYPDSDAERLPGPIDIPSAVAAAASLRAVMATRADDAGRLSELIALIRQTVARTVPDVEVLGDPVERLPHIVTFSCLYVDAESVVAGLDRLGFAVSSGSSCTSSTLDPSHVLVAMGALTSGNIRVSLHRETTVAEVEEFLRVLPGVVDGVRAELGASGL